MSDPALDDEAGRPCFLPAWLPGETLYSLCARYHLLSGNRLAADTARQLFGAPSAGFWHDFPSYLDSFVLRTDGNLGTVREIALGHTLLGFYAPFRAEAEVAVILAAMAGASVRDVKFRLGLPASRIGANHPLKACTVCMQEDLRCHGVAFWHLEHQWPSSWRCLPHGRLLQVCLARNKLRNHLQWLLPQDVAPVDWWRPPLLDARVVDFLERLARMTADLLAQPPDVRISEDIRRACELALHQRSWLRDSHGVQMAKIRQALLIETAGIERFRGMAFVADVAREDGGFVGLLLRHSRGHQHPVKILVLLSFLFGDFAEFWARYQAARTVKRPVDPRRAELAALMAEEGMSISEAARRLVLPLTKVTYWAQKDGIPYRRRPRLIDKAMAEKLSAALRNGVGCNELAKRLELPVDTVRRFLDTHAEVRACWNQAWKKVRTDL